MFDSAPQLGLTSEPSHETDPSPRSDRIISLGGTNLNIRTMIYGDRVGERPSLVILNSIEFPMPPSEAFCERMWSQGLQVVFIERPGFGTSTSLPRSLLTDALIENGAAASAEAALIERVFQELGLRQVVLLGMGSANPVCYRLTLMSRQTVLSIYSNVVFNKDILDVFKPKWFQQMLRQTVQLRLGFQITALGVKYKLRHNPLDFYRQLFQQSSGDLAYLEDHHADFLRAATLFQKIDQSTLNYDLSMSLKPDHLLKDGFFRGKNAIAFSGVETPDHWRVQLDSEAERLAIPVIYVPRGDFLAPYASPDHFLKVIAEHTKDVLTQ